MATTDGSVTVAFDGHVHNHRALEHDLRARGWQADLSSDPALVLALYTEYGEMFVQRLRGIWSLLVWDARSHRLFISRDPLGVRPLYYFVGVQHLLVASEIKSILHLEDAARSVDRRRIRDLVREGLIDDWSGTCFTDIRPVAPGTVLELRAGQCTSRRYWELRLVTSHGLGPGDIREMLVAAVERHTPRGIKVGLALSGGIDSSTIAGVLAQSELRETRSVHAFSITPPHTIDESPLIDATIRHTGIPHTYVPLESLDYPRTVARLIDCHDEPVGHSGALYQFVLRQRMAEAGCQAVAVGHGADEIFGGYRGLAPAFLLALVLSGRIRDSARFLLGAREFVGLSGQRLIDEMLRHARFRGRSAAIRALKHTRAYGVYRRRKGSRVRTAEQGDVLVPLETAEESGLWEGNGEYQLHDIDQWRVFFRALLEMFRRNIPLLVRQEDRNAMAHGLELCAPFMDGELVSAALAFPFHEYMDGGWNKAVLRAATRGLLADEVAGFRKKLVTPGSDQYVAFDALQREFPERLRSAAFHRSGLWSRRCAELYEADAVRRVRGELWFRVFMVQEWYERVVRGGLT